jgi:hypothetical protein
MYIKNALETDEKKRLRKGGARVHFSPYDYMNHLNFVQYIYKLYTHLKILYKKPVFSDVMHFLDILSVLMEFTCKLRK